MIEPISSVGAQSFRPLNLGNRGTGTEAIGLSARGDQSAQQAEQTGLGDTQRVGAPTQAQFVGEESFGEPVFQRPGEPSQTAGAGEQRKEQPTPENPGGLTPEELQVVRSLQIRDRQVRQHEQAHVAVAGRFKTSGPTFQFTTGPDGRQYAVGGEVGISTSPESTPEASLVKARTVRRAALAPADP